MFNIYLVLLKNGKYKRINFKTKPFAQEDINKSWTLLINTILLCAIGIAGTTIKEPVYLRCLFSIVTGLLIVRIFIFYHDFHHKAIFKGSKLAKFILNT